MLMHVLAVLEEEKMHLDTDDADTEEEELRRVVSPLLHYAVPAYFGTAPMINTAL